MNEPAPQTLTETGKFRLKFIDKLGMDKDAPWEEVYQRVCALVDKVEQIGIRLKHVIGNTEAMRELIKLEDVVENEPKE